MVDVRIETVCENRSGKEKTEKDTAKNRSLGEKQMDVSGKEAAEQVFTKEILSVVRHCLLMQYMYSQIVHHCLPMQYLYIYTSIYK